jgi:hypothetical protein
MAKEIKSSIKLAIASSGSSGADGSLSTTEDLAGKFVGFQETVGTAAAAINLGIATPKVIFIQNTDPDNSMIVDNVSALNGWPQAIPAGAGVLLRPSSGTLYAKANVAPVKAWIVAG